MDSSDLLQRCCSSAACGSPKLNTPTRGSRLYRHHHHTATEATAPSRYYKRSRMQRPVGSRHELVESPPTTTTSGRERRLLALPSHALLSLLVLMLASVFPVSSGQVFANVSSSLNTLEQQQQAQELEVADIIPSSPSPQPTTASVTEAGAATATSVMEGEEELEIELEDNKTEETQQPSSDQLLTLNYDSFPQCNYTTQQLMELSPTDAVAPCIIFDIQPERLQIIPYRTTLITLVQVTPALVCNNARDGATTSVRLLNAENDGKGIAIGFQKDYYIQFRLVSIIAGNQEHLGGDLYGQQHAAVLKAAATSLKANYIVGTCSFAAAHEKQPALDTQTMVLAQVGPPGYYRDDNPYVFGVHINSDDYPIPAVRALGFQAATAPPDSPFSLQNLPVRVLYRTQSEFFHSTCQSALSALKEFGFTNIMDLPYDPEADHDDNGLTNQLDEEFLLEMADQACPPGSGDYDQHYNPALFACLLKEQDIVLQRWKENGCRPLSLWLTAATWGWAADNHLQVPYMQGGGQWHEGFTYSDRFFDSGMELLEYNEKIFGYYGSYDTVVAYAIPMIFAEHIETFYRVVDDPDPSTDFSSEEGYERLRRAMVVMNADTIFGPVSFNQYQRNIGRGAAGTQWQPQQPDGEYRNVLVSPFLQAEAEVRVPAPSAVNCTPGHYVNETLVTSQEGAILGNKCDQCPVDTFTARSNQQLQCNICPEGSTALEGQAYCVQQNDNLLSTGTLAWGYLAVSVTWMLSLTFIGWLIKHRKNPVVLLSQIEFMLLVCVGAIISTSTIIALSIQAGSDEDTEAASRACQAAPFLYTMGWVLQYASLSAKSFRLHKIMNHPSRKRVKVTFTDTAAFVVGVLALDLIVVITWTIMHPLEYVRKVISVEVDDTTNVMTINSRGRCAIVDGPSIWAFVGPIVAIHAILMIVTNVILYQVRGVADRYQEQKYVALASVFVCEILVIGLPVVISVGDNPMAVFIVLSGIIALNDIGILCFVFLPKIKYRRKGFKAGINVGETILKDTHRKATIRESVLRQPSLSCVSHASHASQIGTSASNHGGWAHGMSSSLDSSRERDRDSSKEYGLRSSGSCRLPSIISSGMSDASSGNGSGFESLNKDLRGSLSTPQTEQEEYEDEENPADDGRGNDDDDLRKKFEKVRSKNHGLELELLELRQKEETLQRRVEELESLLPSDEHNV